MRKPEGLCSGYFGGLYLILCTLLVLIVLTPCGGFVMMIVVCGVFDELFNLYTMFHYFAAVRLLCSYLYKVKWTPCNPPPLAGCPIKLYIIGYPARGGGIAGCPI